MSNLTTEVTYDLEAEVQRQLQAEGLHRSEQTPLSLWHQALSDRVQGKGGRPTRSRDYVQSREFNPQSGKPLGDTKEVDFTEKRRGHD